MATLKMAILVNLGPQIYKVNEGKNSQNCKNSFKVVESWDSHSESLKDNVYNEYKGLEYFLCGMNSENEIETCHNLL